MSLARYLLVVALFGACVPPSRAEDPPPARPTAKRLAEAILSPDPLHRSHAAGWLATMDETQIREVVEWVHRLKPPSAAGPARFYAHVRTTVAGVPARGVRVEFRRDVTDSVGLLRSLFERAPQVATNGQGEAQIELETGQYRLKVDRAGFTRLSTNALDLAALPQPVQLELGQGVLHVRVVDRFGRPCEGFSVEAWCQAPTMLWLVEPLTAGPGGLVTLRGLPSGQWTVRARGEGGQIAEVQVAAVRDEREASVQVGIPPYGLLLLEAAGNVRDPHGRTEFRLGQGLDQSQYGLEAGTRMRIALPVGAWTLSVDGRREALVVREGETLRRSSRR